MVEIAIAAAVGFVASATTPLLVVFGGGVFLLVVLAKDRGCAAARMTR